MHAVGGFNDLSDLDHLVRSVLPHEDILEDRRDLEEALLRCGLADVRSEVGSYEASESAAEFVATRSLMIPSRLMAKRLEKDEWQRFKECALQRLTGAFREPFTYVATANLAVGRKPEDRLVQQGDIP